MPLPAAFAAFVAPARDRPAIWRLVLGVVVIVVVIALWILAMFGALWLRLGIDEATRLIASMAVADAPGSTLLLLASFIGMALAPVAAARLLHRRGAASLFGPRRRVLRHFLAAAGVVAALYALSLLLWSVGYSAEPNLDPVRWLALLPLSLPLVVIQTGAEEAVFRGYLMQQLAARIPWRLVYMVLPSAIFGALHYDPVSAGDNAALVALGAGLFGLVAADLTRVTGSLGAAWGLHFANNAVAILGVATAGTITGLALYVTPYAADDMAITLPLILVDMATLLLVWALLRWRLRA